jgi:hypothetical protein
MIKVQVVNWEPPWIVGHIEGLIFSADFAHIEDTEPTKFLTVHLFWEKIQDYPP